MNEFLIEWKQYGFRVALNNALFNFTKWFIGAKRLTATYPEDGETSTDEMQPLGWRVRRFYKWASSRNAIPVKYKKGIEWFVSSLEEFDED